jgi:protein arginine N-methyltransferase 7
MSADITQALQSARYNEAVIVNVSPDGQDEDARELTLVACLDEENGGVMWNDLAALSSDDKIGLKRHLRTKRWVFPMLNDHRRNELYEQAIQKASQEVVRRNLSRKDDFRVLDIGSGTGLLAMMAARHLEQESSPEKKVSVTSLEMSSAMAQLAELTVGSNSLQNQVHIREAHSCELPALEPQAQLCTSELLESGLLGEGWLPALRDAWERHLSENAVVVPQRARVFAQLVEGDCLSKYWGPHESLPDVDGQTMLLFTSRRKSDVLLGGGESGIHIPVHAERLLSGEEPWRVRPLSNPIPVLYLDVSSKASIPGPEGTSQTQIFTPVASGTAHGVLFWWELDLWDGMTYSTQVGKDPWQDHWHQCVFVFTQPTGECPKLIEGVPSLLTAYQDDSRISFSVDCEHHDEAAEPAAKRPRPTNAMNSLVSPERAFQLNDLERTKVLREGVESAMSKFGSEAVVLDLSDFSLCAMIAGLLGAPKVTSLETSTGSVPITAARIAQLANGLPLDPDEPESFQIVQCHPEQLSLEVIGGKPANILVAEPYYEVLEGWHLQEALNYFYIVRALRKRGLIAGGALSVPSYAVVMGCAIEAPDLGQAYNKCNHLLHGFKHDAINEHGNQFSEFDMSLPLWQYNYTPLTESFELARIDYLEGSILNNRTVVKQAFNRTGTCHAMLVWIEYGVSVGDDMKILSTRGRSHRQIFRMLSEAVTVGEGDPGSTIFCCRASLGELKGPEDHQFEIHIEQSKAGSIVDILAKER